VNEVGDTFGIAPAIAARLRRIFDGMPGIDKVWIYGSRARGDHRPASDIDLAVDGENLDRQEFTKLWATIQDEGLIYQIDLTHWQTAGDADFRARIERDRKIFWEPPLPKKSAQHSSSRFRAMC
jgi:predicted nucleotidyltransferase